MVLRAELEAAVEVVVEEAARWEDAYGTWRQAVKVRDRVAERMDRRVTIATGGLSVARWQAVCQRRSVRSVVEAKQKALAIRSRPAVETAIIERHCALVSEDAIVLVARVVLAERSKVMLGYGTAVYRLVDQSAAELRRLARCPPRTSTV